MYWSYLTNTYKNNNDLLTFESNNDLDKLSKGYCELVISNFFSSFSHDYNAIFISEFDPTENPYDRENKFFIEFNDVNKAIEFLNKSTSLSETN